MRVEWYIQSAKGKRLPTKNTLSSKVVLQNEDKIQTFSNKQMLVEFLTTKLGLEEILKGDLQAEMKYIQ